MSLGEGEVLQLLVRVVMWLWALMVLQRCYRCRYLESLATESVSACWGRRPGYRESMASGR